MRLLMLRSRIRTTHQSMASTPRYVTALISALRFRDAQPELLRALDDSEWKQLLVFGDHMHLTIPLAQAHEDYCPAWVRSKIQQNIADNTQRFQMIKESYAEISGVLKNANADYVVLKGFTKSPDYAPEARHRVQGDIDLFCDPASIESAAHALATIGYEPIYRFDDMPWDHLPPLRRETSWQWRGNAYDPEMPLSIELHHCLWDYPAVRCGPKDLSRFWERRVVRQLEDITFPALCPVDNVGYVALNLLRDLLRLSVLASQVYELAWFLHENSHNHEFWMRWTAEHDEELKRVESVSFLLAVSWFHCDLPEAVAEEIERLPVGARRWFELPATSPSPMGWMGPTKDAVWLHSTLISSASERRRIILKRLFPRRARPVNVVVAERMLEASLPKPSLSECVHQYLAYVSARVNYHLRLVAPTLWHGLRWWWSCKIASGGGPFNRRAPRPQDEPPVPARQSSPTI
jgi:hypothetical protein